MCRIAGTQALIVGSASPVPWLSQVTEGASAHGGLGGNLGFVGRTCSTGLRACGRGYSVPHQ